MRCILTQCPTFLHNVLHFDVSLAHWFDNIILYHNDGIFEYTTGTTFQKLIKGCKIFCNALTHLTNRYCLLQKLCFIPCYICVTWIRHCIASKCMTTWQICATMTMWYCSAYLNFSKHDTGAIDRPQGGALWHGGARDYSGIILWYLYSLISSKSMGYRWNNIMAQGEDRSRIMVGRAITGAASALNQCNVRDTVLGNTKIWLSESEKCTFYKQRNTRDNIWKIHHRASTGDGITGAARGLLLSYRGKWSIGSAPL